MEFKKATKQGKFLRLALDGPSGAGKTYSALAISTGLVGPTGRIAVIDTERGSASLYAKLFDFDSLELDTFAPSLYVKAIKAAETAGYDACILDSLTHAWSGTGGALEMVDAKKKGGNNGNDFAAWRDVTPEHNKLVDAMLAARMHIICTMRTKTAYDMEEYTDKGGNRRVKPVKIGMKPIQREGLEYEFTVVGDLDVEHNLIVSKTRIDVLDGRVWSRPGAEFAKAITDWFADAVDTTPAPTFTPPAAPATDPDAPARRVQWERWLGLKKQHDLDDDYLKECMSNFEIAEFKTARPADLEAMLDAVEAEFAPKPKPAPARRPAPAAAAATPSNGAGVADYDGDY